MLGVLFFHAKGALPGGYLGVDLFFVLSGYLITSLLLAEHRDTGRIVLSTFWVRRARRLFPALLSLMPVIAIYGRFFAKPAELQALRADALATLGYVANWRAIFSHKSYWDLFTAPSPLEHTWSLSIEEQFYVAWPLVVVFVLKRHTSRAILVLALVLIALSMAAMVALFDPASPSRVYLGTDTRAGGILAGAALATLFAPNTTLRPATMRKLDAAGMLAALGLGIAWWKLEGSDPFLYRGGFWLTEIAALVLIACAASGSSSRVGRALSFRPLAFVGTISYGVYLWHWPVNVFVTAERVHFAGPWLHVVQFVITFAIAFGSYRFFEQPIRQHGVPFGRPFVTVPAAVALAVLLVVRATNAREVPANATSLAIVENEKPPLPPPESVTFRIMLVGDSTANSLGWGLRGVRRPGVAVELLGLDGCTMLGDTCRGEEWARQTSHHAPEATLVFVGGAYMHGITAEGRWRKACHRAWDDKFRDVLSSRLRDLQSEKGHVWAVTIPYPLGPWESSALNTEVDCINVAIRRAARAVPGVRVLDFAGRLCPKGVCQRELDGHVIRPDGAHFSIEGAAEVSRWVLDEIRADGTVAESPSTPMR